MKISTEPLENRQLQLTIEVDEEQAQQAMRRVARQIARQVNIPGFRKGKAPYELIVQRYGEDTIRQEAVEMLAEEVYREALKQEDIKPYASGALDEVVLHPVTFKFTVPLPPTVELGAYRDYRLKPRKVRVYKKEVQRALEQIREENAILEPVERAAALDDGVVMDLAGRTTEGVEFLRVDDARMLLDAESTDPAPGFAEAIVGMQAGEERTFTLTLPADFAQEELRGQEAEFTVSVTEVYESTLPELDDDLARTVGNFDSLEALEKQVREQMRLVAQEEADEEYTTQVLEAILEQAQVAYPPEMLEETLDEVVEEFERAVKHEARLSLEDYLHVRGQTMEDLREEFEPRAADRLKRGLVLGEITMQEGLEVSEEEIGTHIEEVSATWGARADEIRASLSAGAGRQTVHNRLLADKAVQRLVAIARGEAPEPASAGESEDREAEGQEAGNQEAQAQEREQ